MVVSKRFGQTKVSITQDTYERLISVLHNAVTQFIDDLLTPVDVELVSNCVTNE
jgi:hypothetical protein